MRRPRIISPSEYKLGELLVIAQQYGFGDEAVLLCLAEGVVQASVGYFKFHSFDVPGGIWDISIDQFNDMRGDDGEFVIKMPSDALHTSLQFEIDTLIDTANEKSLEYMSELIFDLLLDHPSIDTSEVEDGTFKWDLLLAAHEEYTKDLGKYHNEGLSTPVFVTRDNVNKFLARIEKIDLDEMETARFCRQKNGGRPENKHWADVYLKLIEFILARTPHNDSLLELTGYDNWAQLARRVYKQDLNDREKLQYDTVERKLKQILRPVGRSR